MLAQKPRFQVKIGLNVDFTLRPDSKTVDLTEKRAKSSFHAACKLKTPDFRSKFVRMLISH